MFTRINNSLRKMGIGNIQSMLVVCALGLVVTSCRKDIEPKDRLTSYTGKNYTEVFDAFWNGMNTNYVFWDIETVNWDDIYKTYKPRFEFLDKHKDDPNNPQLATQYLVDMTKDLADGHLELSFNGKTSYVVQGYKIDGYNFQPVAIRHQLRGDAAPIPRKVFDQTIPQNYLTNPEAGMVGNSIVVNLGVIKRNNKNILYLEFPSFQILASYLYNNTTAYPFKPVLDNFFRYTKDPSIDGLIIDLRSNGGGNVSDLDFLLGRLITEPKHFCYTHTKNGTGRLEYTPWMKGYVHPQPAAIDFTNKPVAVLIDNNSVSMSEVTSMAVKAIFPKSALVGTKTWGGTGQIPPQDIRYLGGQFTAANFVKVYTPGVAMRDKNMVSYENKGITPDIQIAYDTTAIKSNIDVQLDKALEFVHAAK
ncbi:S41 family peptidase [Chitinophagaceae bacterium LB-8]|uniref:S41 family peptidase n=1 Tax=Paraflavisolibacter caeni TaxID=2982496 RepID=A0A9X3B6Y2_9BACT|nr:S41 family peptidase [Paraflavisolibacter caeni]MCU7547896.1 S41 family peptidase [Paraflavisolibacter caeni]